MAFVYNFPLFSIILSMFSAIISSVLSGKWAKRVSLIMVCLVLLMSSGLLVYTHSTGEAVTYMMGHFPAPWGNEIRFGVLEAVMAVFFSIVMLLSLLGGMSHVFADVEDTKTNLFFVLIDMTMSSLLAMIYTNDLFTGYVFVEINTIAAAGLIMIRQHGHSLVASIRYLVMSSIGSGLFLIALSILYGITGELLMVPARDGVQVLRESGNYSLPLLLSLGLMSVAMAIKSGLYPFHTWIPDTYGYSTTTASAVLSSLVSKAYIILLIKIYVRVFGYAYADAGHILNVLFVLGLVAMVMGSVEAIRQRDVNRMIAYSSVAQIGYIYMGLGLGTEAALMASLFHIMTHAATKSMLFVSMTGLREASGGKTDRRSLSGAGYRNPLAGITFLVGSLSMVGFPMLSGFISKLLFARAAIGVSGKMLPALLVLALSTILNAIYFLRVVITIYSPQGSDAPLDNVMDDEGHVLTPEAYQEAERAKLQTEGVFLAPKAGALVKNGPLMSVAMVLMMLLNFFLGLCSGPITEALLAGLRIFG
ncbi:MAG: sodium:proton antiporter [Lachnospiraceae bacterium]|nr:sodium:proton antiporter [Lachnospiraceae bacterium]